MSSVTPTTFGMLMSFIKSKEVKSYILAKDYIEVTPYLNFQPNCLKIEF